MLDKALIFEEDRAVTTAGTYTLVDSYKLADLAKMDRERRGAPMEILIQVTEAFASGTSVDFRSFTGSNAALANPDDQAATGAVPTAELTLGKKFRLPLGMNSADADATHLGVRGVSLGTHTAGKFSAWIQAAGTDQDSK